MLLIIQIFLWPFLWLAEKIVIQIWKMFKTRKVTRRRWSGADVVSECLIKYSFQPIVLHPSHILFSMHLLRKSLLNNSLDPIDPRYSSQWRDAVGKLVSAHLVGGSCRIQRKFSLFCANSSPPSLFHGASAANGTNGHQHLWTFPPYRTSMKMWEFFN